jgi:hypothetical protein
VVGEAPWSEWPPSAGKSYLPTSNSRPTFQGDVFQDIPFVKAKASGNPNKDPNVTVDRRLVAILGYPCDMYQNGKLVKVQMVAPVTEATKAGVPADWAGAIGYSPLPDLLGDGVMYGVDLRAAANIDASYLTRDRRVRSLSRLGWTVFRQRIVLCATRSLVSLDDFDAIGNSLWNELELWTRWCELGGTEAEFQPWLDEGVAALGGFTRRNRLEHGQCELVRADLENEARART